MISILVVCTANVCRSPFGEHRLRAALASAGLAELVTVSSAGTRALPGDGICRLAAEQLTTGNAGSDHRARRVDIGMLEDADLVLTAATGHRSAISVIDPGAQSRMFTLLEAVALTEDRQGIPSAGDEDARFRSFVADLDRARGTLPMRGGASRMPAWWPGRRESGDPMDIADGHQLNARAHRSTLLQTADAIDRLARRVVDAL